MSEWMNKCSRTEREGGRESEREREGAILGRGEREGERICSVREDTLQWL